MELNKNYELLNKEQKGAIVSDLVQRTNIGERIDLSTKSMKFAYKVGLGKRHGLVPSQEVQTYDILNKLVDNEAYRLVNGKRPFHLNDITRNLLHDLENRIENNGFAITSRKEDILLGDNNMTEREKEFVSKHFGLLGYNPMSKSKIGEFAGITGGRVDQIVNVGLNKIRRIPQVDFDGINIVYGTDMHIDKVLKAYDESRNELAQENNYQLSFLGDNVENLPFSIRTLNCLKNGEINTVYDLARKSEQDLFKLKNFGRKSLNEIKSVLSDLGINKPLK